MGRILVGSRRQRGPAWNVRETRGPPSFASACPASLPCAVHSCRTRSRRRRDQPSAVAYKRVKGSTRVSATRKANEAEEEAGLWLARVLGREAHPHEAVTPVVGVHKVLREAARPAMGFRVSIVERAVRAGGDDRWVTVE
eukprot:4246321-Prymnesium_polylepis.1